MGTLASSLVSCCYVKVLLTLPKGKTRVGQHDLIKGATHGKLRRYRSGVMLLLLILKSKTEVDCFICQTPCSGTSIRADDERQQDVLGTRLGTPRSPRSRFDKRLIRQYLSHVFPSHQHQHLLPHGHILQRQTFGRSTLRSDRRRNIYGQTACHESIADYT